MLFTAQSIARNQTASRTFQSYGANNLAPASVTDSRILPEVSDSIFAIIAVGTYNVLEAMSRETSVESDLLL